uniref:Morc S5 domain-containing protein n=1 Tax=Leersia perrieri TaxID=77586 RepID=A0A0D9VFV1_9ORYZ
MAPPAGESSAAAGGGEGCTADAVIDVSSSETDSDPGFVGGGKARPRRAAAGGEAAERKRARVLAAAAAVLPPGFLDPLPPSPPPRGRSRVTRQFWHAGDYDGKPELLGGDPSRHHSAFAELLDNSLDEVANGSTYVNIDILENKKHGTRMVCVEDANHFPSSPGWHKRRTQSIGMLSYTFLRETGKDDIIVPMIDYEKTQYWKRMVRTTSFDWQTSLATIVEWSPYSSEAELLQEFSSIKEQGTRIIIYNLWENEQGELELDFDADLNDIQIRGGNRDQKNIQLAKQFPNSGHFFTYRHSLRSYASILYLRFPSVFRMILRGKEIEHHNIIGDLMMKNHVIYKPVMIDGLPGDIDMVTDVTIGFVKDAKHHIPIQGFNVYHKNRLIKPLWRVWTLPGIQGRGIIGVLEVNFLEPAHDKQDFERTNSLARLESRLILMQKTYWFDNCHRIGYYNPTNRKSGREYKETLPEDTPHTGQASDQSPKGCRTSNYLQRKRSVGSLYSGYNNNKTEITSLKTSKRSLPQNRFSSRTIAQQTAEKTEKTLSYTRPLQYGLSQSTNYNAAQTAGTPSRSTSHILKTSEKFCNNENALPSTPSIEATTSEGTTIRSQSEEGNVANNGDGQAIDNPETLENVQKQLGTANKEQEALVDIFTEERTRRDQEVENLQTKLKEASSTIQNLLNQLNDARNCHKS